MGLLSLRGDKIIPNCLRYSNNIVVILHDLSCDVWKKNPKISAEIFFNLNKIIVPTELKTYSMLYYIQRVTTWRSWLRHCYKRRKFAVSNPDGLIGIIFIHIILGSTEPLTEMWPVPRADKFTTFMCRFY